MEIYPIKLNYEPKYDQNESHKILIMFFEELFG